MAKKIRFSLEMENGTEVRELEELKENFSLERVLYYIDNGRLFTWLRDRYHDDVAEQIQELDRDDPDYNKKLCEIFEVEYDESAVEDMERAAERARKLALLKERTGDSSYVSKIDSMAFEQDDLYDLLDEGITEIYLCGERFSVPLGKKNISYIGVNKPTVVISSKTLVDFSEKNITFTNIKFDDKYQALADAAAPKQQASKPVSASFGGYQESYIGAIMTPEQKQKSKELYAALAEAMSGVAFDKSINTAAPAPVSEKTASQAKQAPVLKATSFGEYQESYIGTIMSPEQKQKSKELYTALAEALNGVKFK